MGKILKYCSSCDEGFSERFTFCPGCGASLQAVEMNPVAPVEAAQPVAPEEPAAHAFIAEQAAEEPAINDEPTVDEVAFASAPTEEIVVVPDEVFEAEDAPVIAAPAEVPAVVTTPAFTYNAPEMHADEPRRAVPPPIIEKSDDGYHITVIEEKDGNKRNYLLLGAAALSLTVAISAWGISLFQKGLEVGAIGDDYGLASLIEDVPMPVEEIEEKKNTDKGGGGGGGGREEKEPVNQGDLANQTKDPIRPPDVKVPRLDDPALVLPPASTKGNQKFETKYGKYGDPNSTSGIDSNGPGTGGGIGTGNGTGQGSGSGSGAGSGSGSGYGGGVGNGNGDGRGDGDGAPPAPTKPAVTQPLKILAKQKAAYTDAARTNGVQGTVTLRVTFLASGGIGSISTVKGLPHGLTEQAIAAARNIRFEPEMVNGQARTTTRPVSFTFNIY